jgi:hypothetical protein
MKKLLAALPAMLICIELLTMSCKKTGGGHDLPGTDSGSCRITMIRRIKSFEGNLISADSSEGFKFFYNVKGDPIAIRDTLTVSISNYNRYFRYDLQSRLTDYMVTFPFGDEAIEWHKYEYPAPNIVTDTIFELNNTADPYGPAPLFTPGQGRRLQVDSLDAEGRLAAVFDVSFPDMTRTLNRRFTYNTNGNLVISNPAVTYDDKVNVYRVNKVFQFIYKDFSRNNPIPVGAGGQSAVYNQLGYPTELPVVPFPNAGYSTRPFNFISYSSPIEIEYACPMVKGPLDY